MNWFILTLIFILAMLDAMRDGFRSTQIEKISDEQWHWIKWASWFPLMASLAWYLDWEFLPASPFVGWAGWRVGIKITGRPWESMWTRLIKKWLGKL